MRTNRLDALLPARARGARVDASGVHNVARDAAWVPARRGTSVVHVRLLRARAASTHAERATDPFAPLPGDAGWWLAATSLREAARWALLAHAPELGETASLGEAFEATPYERVAAFAGGEAGLPDARAALLDRTTTDDANARDDEAREVCLVARAFVGRAISSAEAPARRARQAARRPWLRAAAALAALSLFGWGASAAITNVRHPDLAAHRPWHASSAYVGFKPDLGVCDGTRTNITFHTNEENSPWYSVDLGAPRPVAALRVLNRRDGFEARAVPLVVEVSNDGSSWDEVARRDAPFEAWEPSFARRDARFVRLRAVRRTYLHLAGVSVYESPP